MEPATGHPVGAPLRAGTGPVGGVEGVAFSSDGKLLASASASASASGDGTLRLWNPATRHPVGAPLHAGTGPLDSAFAVTFSPDGKLLATASSHGTMRLWDVRLFAHPYAALCADVGPPTQAEWAQYAPASVFHRS